MPEYSILIVQAPAGKLEAAAVALGGVLGIPAGSARPVLQAAPTVLFSGLTYQQARRLIGALAPVAAAGAALALAEGSGGNIAAVRWPAEPVVAGRPLSAYRADAPGPHCPVCGAALRADVRLAEETANTPGAGLPLPDVPRLVREAPSPPTGKPPTENMGGKRRSGTTLEIADLEKVWQERAGTSGRHRSPEPAAKPPRKSPNALFEAVDAQVPELEQSVSGLYDIFVGRSSHPELPTLIAEVRGISIADARRIAQKTIIPVAKGIREDKALEMKTKLEAMGLKPRIVPRSKSSGELGGPVNV